MISEYGGSDALRFRDVDSPDPGPREVRVELHAAGVNFVDVYLRRGEFKAAGPGFVDVSFRRAEDPPYLPFTPGYEGAGVVDAVGEFTTIACPNLATPF